jgi:hypothetical protein
LQCDPERGAEHSRRKAQREREEPVTREDVARVRSERPQYRHGVELLAHQHADARCNAHGAEEECGETHQAHVLREPGKALSEVALVLVDRFQADAPALEGFAVQLEPLLQDWFRRGRVQQVVHHAAALHELRLIHITARNEHARRHLCAHAECARCTPDRALDRKTRPTERESVAHLCVELHEQARIDEGHVIVALESAPKIFGLGDNRAVKRKANLHGLNIDQARAPRAFDEGHRAEARHL